MTLLDIVFVVGWMLPVLFLAGFAIYASTIREAEPSRAAVRTLGRGYLQSEDDRLAIKRLRPDAMERTRRTLARESSVSAN